MLCVLEIISLLKCPQTAHLFNISSKEKEKVKNYYGGAESYYYKLYIGVRKFTSANYYAFTSIRSSFIAIRICLNFVFVFLVLKVRLYINGESTLYPCMYNTL